MESLIDLRELVLKFVRECYPEWAPPRSEKEKTEYSEDALRLTLFNVERKEVKSLLIGISEKNMTIESFISTLSKGLIPMRNDVAGHRQLNSAVRKAAYAVLMAKLTDEQQIVAQNFKNYQDGQISDKLESEIPIIEEIKGRHNFHLYRDICIPLTCKYYFFGLLEKRASRKLIKISNYIVSFHDENLLRKVIHHIIFLC